MSIQRSTRVLTSKFIYEVLHPIEINSEVTEVLRVANHSTLKGALYTHVLVLGPIFYDPPVHFLTTPISYKHYVCQGLMVSEGNL